MAISVDHATYVITIPQSDLTPVSIPDSLYELDVDWFRLALKDWEDGEFGIVMPTTHRHNTQITLAGVTYARTFEVLAPYTVTFEDMGPHYTVRCTGANHNIGDVLNFNSVNLIIANSAGLIVTAGGGGGASAADVWAYGSRTLTSAAPPTAAAIADAVRAELAPELANLDAAVSSRLADADYTAPPAVAAFWQHVVEAGLTAEQMLRLLASVATGNAQGLEGAAPKFRDLANTKDRVVATYSGGTRTVSSRDGT